MVNTAEQKRVTLEDIALRAGVTKSTVSMVFRNKEGISQTTRQRVMEIAKEMKYASFPIRQTHGKVHWGQLGFLIISKENPKPDEKLPLHYFSHMMNGCAAYAEKKGYSTVFSHLDWKQVEDGNLCAVINRGYVDGFLCRAWFCPEVEQMLQRIDVPIVLIDCDQYIEKYSTVQVDNIKAMDLVVDHLVKQGAKRFATITGNMDHQNAQERLAGMQMALTRRGIPFPPEGIVTESDFAVENGRRGARKLLESGYRFDAVVCHFDLAAYGAMEVLTSAGVKVPDDVRVTGFDNEEFSDKIAIPLTTIETYSDNVGRLGAQLLLSQISGENKQVLHVHSNVSLVVRKSA
jgi:LacI family transcriptional regulator